MMEHGGWETAGVMSQRQAGWAVKEGQLVMAGCEFPSPSWIVSEEGLTSLDW